MRDLASSEPASAEVVAGTAPGARRGLPWRVIALVGGDALAFVAFAALGRRSHGEANAVAEVLWTAFPFALAWFLVAPWLSAYRRAQTDGPRRMLARTELAWLASYPLALLLRWALSADHQVPVSFAAVILVANAVLLGGWRGVFALIERARRP